MAALAGDIKRLEQHRSKRLSQMEPALRRWWRYDCELYQKRIPTIGDYVY